MDDTIARPRKRKRVESRVRRGLELFFLAASLIVGLGVVAGCGFASLLFAGDAGPMIVVALLAMAVLLVGAVYLSTSMSRDVRMLKERLLEKEDRDGGAR